MHRPADCSYYQSALVINNQNNNNNNKHFQSTKHTNCLYHQFAHVRTTKTTTTNNNINKMFTDHNNGDSSQAATHISDLSKTLASHLRSNN